MSIGSALKSRYGLDGWSLIDRGQGAGPELVQWDRPEPRPTAEQLAAMCAEEELATLKSERLAQLEAEREAAERVGVTVGNITLASGEYDQRRLATLLVGINEAIGLGLYSQETQIAVTDASDRDVPMTVGQFKQLSVAYMDGCQRQRAEHRAKRAAIQNAATPEELNSI